MASGDVPAAQVLNQAPMFQMPLQIHRDQERSDKETLMVVDAWKNFDYLCQNYVLNDLSDILYGVYCGTKSAKELWETLDQKYKTENARSRKFVIGRFLDYMMMDTKPLISQGDFRNYLKHKRKEIGMNALVGKLRIEDDNRRPNKRSMKAVLKANVVEHGNSSKNKKELGKSSKLGPKRSISKKAKFQGKCFNCDKMGHRATECRLPKRKRNKEVRMMEHILREVDDIDLSTVVSEMNLVISNPKKSWIDTSATHHVCADKNMFTSF
nr:uncharacterized protein LOC125419861 [Ziziphus jujuba var. spinosa]